MEKTGNFLNGWSCLECLEMAWNGCKWQEMARNGWNGKTILKWLKITGNDWVKMTRMTGYSWKCLEMAGMACWNRWKWLVMTGNGWKYLELAGNSCIFVTNKVIKKNTIYLLRSVLQKCSEFVNVKKRRKKTYISKDFQKQNIPQFLHGTFVPKFLDTSGTLV